MSVSNSSLDPSLMPLRVLIVDDQTAEIKLVSKYLSTQGRRAGILPDITSCTSGAAALELVTRAHHENKPFDLIISDHDMPTSGLDGFDFLNSEVASTTPTRILRTSQELPYFDPSCFGEGGIIHIKKTLGSPLNGLQGPIENAYQKHQASALNQHLANTSASATASRSVMATDLSMTALTATDDRCNSPSPPPPIAAPRVFTDSMRQALVFQSRPKAATPVSDSRDPTETVHTTSALAAPMTLSMTLSMTSTAPPKSPEDETHSKTPETTQTSLWQRCCSCFYSTRPTYTPTSATQTRPQEVESPLA